MSLSIGSLVTISHYSMTSVFTSTVLAVNENSAYFGDIRTLIPGVSGQHIGIIRTPYRKHPDTLSS